MNAKHRPIEEAVQGLLATLILFVGAFIKARWSSAKGNKARRAEATRHEIFS
jgi:hypothetical protein